MMKHQANGLKPSILLSETTLQAETPFEVKPKRSVILFTSIDRRAMCLNNPISGFGGILTNPDGPTPIELLTNTGESSSY